MTNRKTVSFTRGNGKVLAWEMKKLQMVNKSNDEILDGLRENKILGMNSWV